MKKQNILKQLEDAYGRLLEAFKIDPTETLALDGTIQRFEFTFELAWKALKVFLEDEGVPCYSPKSCLKAGFRIGWIAREESWLEILKARNMTSHIYNEGMAMEVYNQVKENLCEFEELIKILKQIHE